MRTGRFGFRRGWRGKLILQVEVRSLKMPEGLPMFEWVDGNASDAASVIQHAGNRMDNLGAIAARASRSALRTRG